MAGCVAVQVPVYCGAYQQSMRVNQEIYGTPSWGASPDWAALLMAPRKKRTQRQSLREHQKSIRSFDSIRKCLDFTNVLDNVDCHERERKRRLKEDPIYSRRHCEELAVPLAELPPSPKVNRKRVKFSECESNDVLDILRSIPVPTILDDSVEDLTLQLDACQSPSTPATPAPRRRRNSSLSETPKGLLSKFVTETPSVRPIETPLLKIAIETPKRYADIETMEENPIPSDLSDSVSSKMEKPSDWEKDFITPVYEPSFRRGVKPEPSKATSLSFTDLMEDTPTTLFPPKLCRKIQIASPEAPINTKRSVRSLSFI